MKKFKGMKTISQIEKEATEQGWAVDMTEFEKGSDWFWLRDMDGRFTQICVNCFGRFMVYKPFSDEPVATERSEELDNEDWYNEILDLLYESVEVQNE
jgi:hypothetical protein